MTNWQPKSDASSTSCCSDDQSSGNSFPSNHMEWIGQSSVCAERTFLPCAETGTPFLLHQHLKTAGQSSSPTIHHSDPVIDDKSSDGFRSVIDDLTIENKRLKEKLRQYHKKASTALEKDKLFELRIHSLPLAKRRELEIALQSFASSLQGSAGDPQNSATSSSQKNSASNFAASSTQLKSSSISHIDSFMHGSTIDSKFWSDQSNMALVECVKDGENLPSYPLAVLRAENKTNSRSSLSKGNAKKSIDRQKKKLVVRRLEQLFTGKEALTEADDCLELSHHDNSKRSKNISHSRGSSLLGAREAFMDAGLNSESFQGSHRSKIKKPNPKEINSSSSDNSLSDSSSIAQRPTCAHDLDPDRAQIPSKNMEYMRHLGFETEHRPDANSTDPATTNGGWVYLNLLINMAQLHTINVTANFVRSAVSECSEKFEISSDGHMLRWRGGSDGTNLSSDTSTSSEQDSESQKFLAPVPVSFRLKKPKHVEARLTKAPIIPPKVSQSIHYQPLFYHNTSSGSLSDSYDSSATSESQRDDSIDKSKICPSHICNPSTGTVKDCGLIVYYSGAEFCTDLAGEPLVIPSPMCTATSEGQDACASRSSSSSYSMARTDSGSLLPYRPFRRAPDNPECSESVIYAASIVDRQNEASTDQDLFVYDSPDENHQSTLPLISLESSGISTILSTDQFTLQVLTRRPVASQSSPFIKFNSPSHTSQKSLHQKSSVTRFLPTAAARILTPLPRHQAPETLPIQPKIISVQMKS